MIRKFKKFDVSKTGMSYKVFSQSNGGLPNDLPTTATTMVGANDSLQLKILASSGSLLPEKAIFTIIVKMNTPGDAVDSIDSEQVALTGGDSWCILTEGTVTSIVKNYDSLTRDYMYSYYITAAGVSGPVDCTQTGLIEVVVLDYENYILPVDKTGTGADAKRVDYYFDNTLRAKLNSSATPSVNTTDYWNGTLNDATLAQLSDGEELYRTSKYPIMDFFDSKFTKTLENNSVVWIRRKASGGVDSLTFQGNVPSSEDGIDGDVTYTDDVYVIRVSEPKAVSTSTTTYDKTAVQALVDPATLPSTTAKFVGYPVKAGAFEINANEEVICEKLDPYFFLAPTDVEDIDGDLWEDDTQKSPTWYVNGHHQIGCRPIPTSEILKALTPYNVSETILGSASVLKYCKYDGTIPSVATTPTTKYTVARNSTLANSFIPGDGNEFYNMKFFRNDGSTTLGAVTLKASKGIKFTNCTFRSDWDIYQTYVSSSSTLKYNGNNSVGPAINLDTTYDIDFIDCTFERNSGKPIAVNGLTADGTNYKVSVFDIVLGNNEQLGLVPTFSAKESGNLRMRGCHTVNNFGQACNSFVNVDNLDMEGCTAETYYHGTDRTRNDYEKPIGFQITQGSTSAWLKGCAFYGEGIGFYLEDMNDMVYPLMENCSAIANGDEAYFFKNVNYLKLRKCYGETISKSVFYTLNSRNPIFYDCRAKSDTGIGYDYVSTSYWRTNDCHVLSGSGLNFDLSSIPGKIDFGSFVQTANSMPSYFNVTHASTENSLIGIKLWDAPYKTTIRNLYFQGVKNDIDIDKGPNVELYLENSHFTANQEINGEYNSPAYFIHKGFSGVWEYRDIGGSITTSAVHLVPAEDLLTDSTANFTTPDFSLSFKSSVNNELGRPSITLGNSNEETQYLELEQGLNKVTIYLMGRLLDVENPLTNLGIWAELKYKDRSQGDPHITTYSTRGKYNAYSKLTPDTINNWVIGGNQQVPDQKAYKIEFFVKAGQKCSCPLTICYEYYTTIGEIYVHPYASVINFSTNPTLAAKAISQTLLSSNDLILKYDTISAFDADVDASKVIPYDGTLIQVTTGDIYYVDVKDSTPIDPKNWIYTTETITFTAV